MTAADWPLSSDPLALYRRLRGRATAVPSRWFGWVVGLPAPLPEIKLRQLLDAACDHPPTDPNPLRAALAGFRDDGQPALAALAALYRVFTGVDYPAVAGAIHDRVLLAALADDRHNPPLADAIRCLFADPFHPIPDPAGWRTGTAVRLAEGIVADGAFDRLPVLADALEDGGCDHAPLLAHLRAGGPHRPGCHALDVVLAR